MGSTIPSPLFLQGSTDLQNLCNQRQHERTAPASPGVLAPAATTARSQNPVKQRQGFHLQRARRIPEIEDQAVCHDGVKVHGDVHKRLACRPGKYQFLPGTGINPQLQSGIPARPSPNQAEMQLADHHSPLQARNRRGQVLS